MNDTGEQGRAGAGRRRSQPQRGKRQQDGPLEGHFKSGRTYRPSLMALEQFQLADWVRDDLPDMLWPAALIALEGDRGGIRFGRLQQDVNRVLAPELVALDGRLTSLEAVPVGSRATVLPTLQREISDAGAMPGLLLAALRLYPDLPGRWLLVDAFDYRHDEHAPDDALSFLSEVVRVVAIDGHREALLKFVPMAWAVVTGNFRSDQDTIDVLKTYPGDATLRSKADTVIRASFNATMGVEEMVHPELQPLRQQWAASFWRQNWRISACLPEELLQEPEADADDSPEMEDGSVTPDPGATERGPSAEELPTEETALAGELSDQLVSTTSGHLDRYLREALSADLEVDLLDPARHEVISALVTRTGRSVVSVLRADHQWSSEHAASLMRELAETEILLVWLDAQPPAAYRQYQDYGRGKEKLMRRQMTKLAGQFPDGPPEHLARALTRMEKKLGGEWGEEFIEVNLDSNFAGKSVRAMAAEVGLEDLYRHVYQGASAVLHGEWHTLEDNVMQRCLNPLHRFHQIPSLQGGFVSHPELASYFSDKFGQLVDRAVEQLRRPPTPGAETTA